MKSQNEDLSKKLQEAQKTAQEINRGLASHIRMQDGDSQGFDLPSYLLKLKEKVLTQQKDQQAKLDNQEKETLEILKRIHKAKTSGNYLYQSQLIKD